MKAVAPLVAQIRDRSLWDAYARKSAGRIGVDLEVMRREVMNARRQMHVRDEDAYAPKRRFERDEPRVEPGTNPYANPATRSAVTPPNRHISRSTTPYSSPNSSSWPC